MLLSKRITKIRYINIKKAQATQYVNYWFNNEEVCSTNFLYFFAIPFGATRGAEMTSSPLTNTLNTIRLHSASLSHTLYILSLSSASGFHNHGPEQRRVYRQEWPEGYVRSFRWTVIISAIRHCRSALVDEASLWQQFWPLPPQAAWTSNKRSWTRC